LRRIWLAGVLFALGACAHAPIQPSDTHLRAEGPAPSGTVPAPIQISTILPIPKPTQRPETYSVVVNGVRAQELLFALARDAKLNIDVHPGITGAVTLNAIEQTLPQLLSRISKQIDMRWELDGPNLIVMPDSPYLHTYRIDYVNMERTSTGTVGVSSQIGTGGGTAGGEGPEPRRDGRQQLQHNGTQYFQQQVLGHAGKEHQRHPARDRQGLAHRRSPADPRSGVDGRARIGSPGADRAQHRLPGGGSGDHQRRGEPCHRPGDLAAA